MPQVPATQTPSNASHVAAAIIAAYQTVRGRAPTKNAWLWPLALSANETASWASMFNWNVGNVTTTGDAVAWYLNPKVKATLRFRSFDSAYAGALSMLNVLAGNGGLAAAEANDQAGWQRGLNAYLGATYPDLSALVTSLQNTVPEGGAPEIITVPAPAKPVSTFFIVTVVAGIAGAVGYAIRNARAQRAPEPSPEPEFDYWSRL